MAFDKTYGLPFSGYYDTVDKHEVPDNAMATRSVDLLTVPNADGNGTKLVRRKGAQIYSSQTGCLEVTPTYAVMRCIKLFELATKVSSDGYPVLAGLFTDEAKKYGQLWLRDGSTDYVELEEFGSTHYPVVASTQGNIKVVPLIYDGDGASGYTRGAYEENRRRMLAGSRGSVGFLNYEYFPSWMCTPSKFNREYNLNPGSGSNNLIHYPTGHIMPLWPPTCPTADYPTAKTTAAPWAEGDTFFGTIAFEWEDGSVSFPFIPRDKNSVLTAGLGLYTVYDDGDATTEYYDYIPLRNIPIGPPGVVRRRWYRTDKINKTDLAAGAWPDIGTLKLSAIIDNNTTVSYNDNRGNDSSLATDANLRADQIWPSRGMYAWSFDHRHAIGRLRDNPCAIVVAPTGLNTSRDINAGYDDASLISATAFLVQIRRSTVGALTLYLRKTAYAAAPTETTFSLVAGTTLQSLVDQICAMTTASTGGEWSAQLVPGVDPDTPSDWLAPTFIQVPNCTMSLNDATLTTTDSFADIPLGMKINHANFPAGTYVLSRTSSTSIELSANAMAGAGPVTVDFHVDTGDDSIPSDGSKGNMRAYGNAIPIVLGFQQDYLDRSPEYDRDFIVTTAGPLGRPNVANMFHASPGGRYSAEVEAGMLMGGAPLDDGCVVFYANRIGYYKNTRSGSTGEDQDYRMRWLSYEAGCTSPYSITYGNGWVGCWRKDGYWVFDGDRERIITPALFDQGKRSGKLAYEANLCQAAAAADTNDFYLFASFVEGRLWIGARIDGSDATVLCYDATPSIESSGIGQLLKPDGSLYGWSSPLSYSWRSYADKANKGAIGWRRTSSGIKLYQSDDRNDKTNCGLVQEFETTGTYRDGTDPVQWKYYSKLDFSAGGIKFSIGSPITIFYKHTIASGTSPLTMYLYRDQAEATSPTLTIPATAASSSISRAKVNTPLKARALGEVLEIYLTGGSDTDDGVFELSGIVVPIEPSSSYV